MIVDCAYYLDGRRQGEGPVELADVKARRGQGGFVWLGLCEPAPQELDQVRDAFGLHELAVEDARTFHLRPKAELYEATFGWSSCGLRAMTTRPRRSTSARSASSPRRTS